MERIQIEWKLSEYEKLVVENITFIYGKYQREDSFSHIFDLSNLILYNSLAK